MRQYDYIGPSDVEGSKCQAEWRDGESGDVPMDVDEVDIAPVTRNQEVHQPGKSFRAIGDSRRSQVHIALEPTLRLHPLLPCLDSGIDIHADSAGAGTGTCY